MNPPSLGIKIDACPGRLNQVSTFIERSVVYYGQKSDYFSVNAKFCNAGSNFCKFCAFLKEELIEMIKKKGFGWLIFVVFYG